MRRKHRAPAITAVCWALLAAAASAAVLQPACHLPARVEHEQVTAAHVACACAVLRLPRPRAGQPPLSMVQIRRAYRAAALLTHPDVTRAPDNGTEYNTAAGSGAFVRVQTALQVLEYCAVPGACHTSDAIVAARTPRTPVVSVVYGAGAVPHTAVHISMKVSQVQQDTDIIAATIVHAHVNALALLPVVAPKLPRSVNVSAPFMRQKQCSCRTACVLEWNATRVCGACGGRGVLPHRVMYDGNDNGGGRGAALLHVQCTRCAGHGRTPLAQTTNCAVCGGLGTTHTVVVARATMREPYTERDLILEGGHEWCTHNSSVMLRVHMIPQRGCQFHASTAQFACQRTTGLLPWLRDNAVHVGLPARVCANLNMTACGGKCSVERTRRRGARGDPCTLHYRVALPPRMCVNVSIPLLRAAEAPDIGSTLTLRVQACARVPLPIGATVVRAAVAAFRARRNRLLMFLQAVYDRMTRALTLVPPPHDEDAAARSWPRSCECIASSPLQSWLRPWPRIVC